MAVGTELATAYVSLVPSTSKLGDELSKYFNKTERQADESGKRSGNRFTRAFGKWAKRGAVAAGVAVGAAVGAAVVGGVKSAIDQQQGQLVLRSEEHTSELQSRGHLVCRLLLEKKRCRTRRSE